jgi:HSP20 family protein
MPVFRWRQDWNPFQDLEREVDRLLNSVNFAFQGVRLGRSFPQINFFELEDRYLLTAELPGVRSSDLELSIADGRLTLKGERRPEGDFSENCYRRTERFQGAWQRTVALPDRVREEGLQADLNHGILRITFPKAPETLARRIPIQEGVE